MSRDTASQRSGGALGGAGRRSARVEADRQQRYVAAFVRPTLPEEALYPRRIVASITAFAGALLVWARGLLIVCALREHAL